MDNHAQYLLDSKRLDVNHDCGSMEYPVCSAESETGITECRLCWLFLYTFFMGLVMYRAPPIRVSESRILTRSGRFLGMF